MSLQVEPAALADKTIIRRLLELYFYDATEFTGGDLNPHGEFGYRYLDHYWSNDVPPARFPFLFRVDGQIAGFAFVRISENIYSMAEFFILGKYRRSGLGTAAALDLFARFPGGWEVTQLRTNLPAQAFWTGIIRDLTGGHHATFEEPLNVGQRFTLPAR